VLRVVSKYNGFVWQGFVIEGATGVTSVRSCEKLPQCPVEPLDKAEPISDSGSSSVITYLRWEKNQ